MKYKSLPSNYRPPKKMQIGTNSIENVQKLVSFKGHIPILIGEGKIPHIWINVPVNQEGNEWYPLVKDNFSTNQVVIVIKRENGVKVTTPDGVVIDCEIDTNGDIYVKKLNLRPFGINVFADEASLNVMGTTFTSSGFNNVDTVVGIG
ncbi:hypothetical protein AB4238_01555 [Shewanella sp. 10N.286.45.A1]|uniref:hypothetical protein n=1 Tax=Shewanella sp. 10N.286.45.A1 TaxID=3229694 RepID=UPI00355251AF